MTATLDATDLIARVRQFLDDDELSTVYACLNDRARTLRVVAWQRQMVDDYERVVEWLRRADVDEPQAVADDEDDDAPDEFGVQALGVEAEVLRRVMEGILSEHEGDHP